ncbi:MAG: DUF6754 domain-containing protein [Anaerolineae bacterium]
MVESILASLDVSLAAITALGIAMITLVLALLSRRARKASLRPIDAYETIRQAPTRAVESDLPMHISLGSGGLGSEATPESAAALGAARFLAEGGAAATARTMITAGDGTLAVGAMGLPDADALYAGSDPMAYAAGAAAMARASDTSAQILFGDFGDEGLWLAGALCAGRRTPVGGTAEPSSAALMYAVLDEALVGEEVYAAGAYLGEESQVASLVALDVLRWLGILALVVGTLAVSFGWWR